MNYYDTVNHAIELVIETNIETNMSYLEPRYREILREADIHLPNGLPDEELYELLKLEVEKRNTAANKTLSVMQWLYEVLIKQVEPAMLDEENELMQRVLEYMKMNINV